ncbi:Zinc knuckle CX2CX4HX4C [Arabidopsis suecica]|uniref:Zinc knuckle CX2CX4HX4C n=1 Tax=Arabidopsis suecica TaxID=45249 RepID=A0A8T1ZVA3_ARASU|nr:Zinc knuckle CX2CX4HX4C [Arabidopsis suecica]
MSQRYSRSEKAKWVAGSLRVSRKSPVRIPDRDTTALAEENRLTLIGRVTNPKTQKSKAIVDYLPQVWNLENRVSGRELGPEMFQFRFETEADLQMVLQKSPYHHNKWMIILQRWEPIISASFPAIIPFWITIHKLPALLWDSQTVRTIGKEVGPVIGQDATQGRVRVEINGLLPLEKTVSIRLPSGEITMVELEYEKLEKHCFHCCSLSHEKKDCLLLKTPEKITQNLSRGPNINQTNTLSKLEVSKQAEALRKDKRNFRRDSSYNRSSEVDRAFELDIQKAPPPRRRSQDRRDFRREHIGGYNRFSKETHHAPSRDRSKNYSHDVRSGSQYSHRYDQRTRSPSRSRFEEDQRRERRTDSRRSPSKSHNYGLSQRTQRSSDMHTPSPNSPREPIASPAQRNPQSHDSLKTNSSARRPALERLTEIIPVEVPFQGGGGSTGSSRLQEVAILYEVDNNQENLFATFPQQSAFLPGESSANPVRALVPQTENCVPSVTQQDALPQQRVHASLRLGPARAAKAKPPTATKAKPKGMQKTKAQPAKRGPKKTTLPAGQKASANASSSKPAPKRRVTNKAPPAKPRGPSSPLVGVSLRKRNTTRAANPPRKRLCTEANPVFETEADTEDANFTVSGSNPMRRQNQGQTADPLDFRFPPQGLSGGLALFWKEDISLEILDSSANLIDVKFKHKQSSFHTTFIYGPPQKENRGAFWDQLGALGESRDSAWVLTGDFNDILDNSEKIGGPPRHEGSFLHFRSFVSQQGLWDVKHTGDALSWRGMRYEHFIRSRLDRTIANAAWTEMFPSGWCSYLRYEGSDHRPLITFFDTSRSKKRGLFRFDRRLRQNPEIREIIDECWNNPIHSSVLAKTNACRQGIVKWSKSQFANSSQQIKDNQEALEIALSNPVPDRDRITALTARLEKAYKEEEQFWRQRSRILWLQGGDRNTGFFHASTRNRRAQNRLSVMEDEAGHAVHEEDQIAKTISEYYQNLFTADPLVDLSALEDIQLPLVSQSVNDALIKIPDKEEIRKAVFGIHPDKAPGPDGFSAGFYHSYWDVIGDDICKEIQDFFVTPPPPPYNWIQNVQVPTFANGWLYWFRPEKTKLVAFDLHTEVFRIVLNPINDASSVYMQMGSLNDDRGLVWISETNGDGMQHVWRLSNHNTGGALLKMDKMFSIDLNRITSTLFDPREYSSLLKLMAISKNGDKAMLPEPRSQNLLLFQPLNSTSIHYHIFSFSPPHLSNNVLLSYFPSLASLP